MPVRVKTEQYEESHQRYRSNNTNENKKNDREFEGAS